MSDRRSIDRARFFAVAALALLAGICIVEGVQPERYVTAPSAAEVEVTFADPRHAPTADGVRRRALSTANLTAVHRRLVSSGSATSDNVDDDAVAAKLDQWRRQTVVEVRPADQADRRSLRFVAVDAADEAEAAAVVAAIAAQYAGESASVEVLRRIDALRGAEEEAAAAVEDVIETFQNTRHAAAAPIEAPQLRPALELPDFPEDKLSAAPYDAVDAEMQTLLDRRRELLHTLQPAHPEVAALDARIDALQTALAPSPVRRMAYVAVAAELPSVDGLPAEVTAAVRRLAAARDALRSQIDEFVGGASIVDVPVVTMQADANPPWRQRPFWYLLAAPPALLIGWAVSRRRDATLPHVSQPAPHRDVALSPPALPSPPPAVADTPPPHEPAVDEPLRTVQRAAEAVRAPLLGVVSRRGAARSPAPQAVG